MDRRNDQGQNSILMPSGNIDQAIVVRRCRSGDLSPLSDLLKVCWHSTYEPILGQARFAQLNHSIYSKLNLGYFIAQSLLSRATQLLVATREQALVGHAMVQRDGQEIILYSLYVHPDWQGRGIGSLLLDAAIAGLPGAKAIRLEVLKDNAQAITWYQAKGFDTYGDTEHATGTTGIASVYMDKQLSGTHVL
jgi:ribosomal protein S18 acetylase RimI-like enzyme